MGTESAGKAELPPIIAITGSGGVYFIPPQDRKFPDPKAATGAYIAKVDPDDMTAGLRFEEAAQPELQALFEFAKLLGTEGDWLWEAVTQIALGNKGGAEVLKFEKILRLIASEKMNTAYIALAGIGRRLRT